MILRLVIIIFVFLNFTVYAVERTSSEIVYSKQDKVDRVSTLAEMWGLTEADITKYKTIMKGPRGNFSPDIAPPLALALEESNHAEKTRYLTVYAKLEHDRTRKDLETSRMYSNIFNALFSEPVINKDILFNDKEQYIKESDRFVIFIDAECMDCKSNLLLGLMKTASFPKNPTDIFVKNLSKEEDLHRWATENSIKVDAVQNGDVTLNLMQENTIPLMKTQKYLIYVLRNNSLFNFTN